MCFYTMGIFSIDGCWLLYNPWEEAIFYRSENGSVWVPVELFRCRVIGCYGNCKLLHASGKSSFFSNLAIRILSAVASPYQHKCACKLRVFEIERMWLFSQVFAHQVHTQPYMKYIILTLLCISRFLFILFLFLSFSSYLFLFLCFCLYNSFFLSLTLSLSIALFFSQKMVTEFAHLCYMIYRFNF